MKKRRIILLIMLILTLINLGGCTKTAEPEDTIYKMEEAFNDSDMDALLECYEPKVQKMYDGVMAVGGALLGVDMNTVIGGLGAFANLYGKDFGADMPEVDITINSKEEINEDKVKMNLTMKYDYSQQDISDQTMDIYVVKIDDKWYISAETPR